MSIAPIAAHHVRQSTEALAHSARPDAPIRPEPAARPRWWMRRRRELRLPLALRPSLGRRTPAVE